MEHAIIESYFPAGLLTCRQILGISHVTRELLDPFSGYDERLVVHIGRIKSAMEQLEWLCGTCSPDDLAEIEYYDGLREYWVDCILDKVLDVQYEDNQVMISRAVELLIDVFGSSVKHDACFIRVVDREYIVSIIDHLDKQDVQRALWIAGVDECVDALMKADARLNEVYGASNIVFSMADYGEICRCRMELLENVITLYTSVRFMRFPSEQEKEFGRVLGHIRFHLRTVLSSALERYRGEIVYMGDGSPG